MNAILAGACAIVLVGCGVRTEQQVAADSTQVAGNVGEQVTVDQAASLTQSVSASAAQVVDGQVVKLGNSIGLANHCIAPGFSESEADGSNLKVWLVLAPCSYGQATDFDVVAEKVGSALVDGDKIRLRDRYGYSNCIAIAPGDNGRYFTFIAPCGRPSTDWTIKAKNAGAPIVDGSTVRLVDTVGLGNCLALNGPRDGMVQSLIAPCGAFSTDWTITVNPNPVERHPPRPVNP